MSDLTQLEDKLAIRDQLHRYCRAYDRLDRDIALSVFHPEGRAHYPGLPEMDVAAMVDTTLGGNHGYTHSSHQITSALIELSGDEASSEAYGIARALELAEDGTVVEHNWSTRYLDRWVRHVGTWRILHRRTIVDCYTVTHTGQQPIVIPNLDPGLVPHPDRSDPVFAMT